jgi:hypothetical protein
VLSYSLPSGFQDVSEYTFGGKDRRIIIRSGDELGSEHDLTQAAEDHVHHLQSYLGAVSPTISEVKQREDKSQYITLSAQVPGKHHPLLERAAYILFPNGKTIQLNMSAKPEDSQAGDEFDAVVKSVRPAAAMAVKVPLRREANDAVLAERFAGAALVQLPGEYRNMTTRRFRNADGTRRIAIRVEGEGEEAAGEPPKSSFAQGTTGVDDLGKAFRYEVGKNLWKPRGSTPGSADRAVAVTGSVSAGAWNLAEKSQQFGDARVTVAARSTVNQADAQSLVDAVLNSIKSDRPAAGAKPG